MDRRAADMSDEELLTQLAASFPVEQIEPDASSLHQLSVAVAEIRRPAVAAAPTRTARTARRRTRRISLPRRLSPVLTVGSVVGALAMGSGISYAVGVPIPAAVRSVARTVGLEPPAPTPAALSPAVVAAQQAESTLHQALTNGHSSSAEISRDTSELAHRLARVGDDHTPGAQRVSDDGHHLLREACPHIEGSSRGSGASSSTPDPCAGFEGRGGGSPGGPSTGTGTTTSGGDHGDGTRGGGGGAAPDDGTSGSTEPAGGSSSSGSPSPSGGSTGATDGHDIQSSQDQTGTSAQQSSSGSGPDGLTGSSGGGSSGGSSSGGGG